MTLSFALVHDVIYAYDLRILSDNFLKNDKEFNDFMTHFEKTWIGFEKRNYFEGNHYFQL